MAIDLDSLFAKKADYLLKREKKAEVIATNIANADTPGYKAINSDFGSIYKKAQIQQSVALTTTNEQHLSQKSQTVANQYRIPRQPDTGDGNNVDLTVERNLFLRNSLEYQYALRSIDGLTKGLKKAINGGSS